MVLWQGYAWVFSASHSLCSACLLSNTKWQDTKRLWCLSAVWPSIKLGCWYICYCGSPTVRSLVCITATVQWENIDGLQMPIKHPTSRGQTHNQEVAVQRTFHYERSKFFYLSTLMVRTQHSAVFSCTERRSQLLSSGSEAMLHKSHLYSQIQWYNLQQSCSTNDKPTVA